MTKKIYLDYAATTPIDEEVLTEMIPYFNDKFGNASSIHTFGQITRTAIETARDSVSKILHAKPNEIYFTSGGTEAINLAIFGTAFSIRKETGKDHVITSTAEHHATLECCERLQEEGFEVTFLNPNDDGNVHASQVHDAIRANTALVSIMHINNEVGSETDIDSISSLTKGKKVFLHVDAVQSFAKYNIDLTRTQIDLLSASSHKIFGPKGAGCLFIRQGTPIEPIIIGGSQERKKRGGTENTPAIVGFAKAAELFYEKRKENFKHVTEIKNRCVKIMESWDNDIFINSPSNNCSPYILNFSMNPERYSLNSDSLIMNLDLKGIAVSSGSACTSGIMEPSHVLNAMNFPKERAERALRFSFSRRTTLEEIGTALTTLKEILNNSKRK